MVQTISIDTVQLKSNLYSIDNTSDMIINTVNSSNSDIIVFHELIFGYSYDDLFLQPDLSERGKKLITDNVSDLLGELIGSNVNIDQQLNFDYTNNFNISNLNAIGKILNSGCTTNKLIVLSAPIVHKKRLYNCNLYLSNNNILLVRPKTELANESHYHEPRHFSYYEYREQTGNLKDLEQIVFPSNSLLHNHCAPFGIAIIEAIVGTTNVKIASEICEELWCDAPTLGNYLILNDVDILINTSSSYFEIDKLATRMELIKNASSGVVYVYCNNCGEQSYNNTCMDGASMVYADGKLLLLMEQFPIEFMQRGTVTVDIEKIKHSRQRHDFLSFPKFDVLNTTINHHTNNTLQTIPLTKYNIANKYEQCLFAMMLWLYEYYEKSGATYLFLPLSGGLDSGLTSAIVYGMCKCIIVKAFATKNMKIIDVIIKRLSFANALERCTNLSFVIECYKTKKYDCLPTFDDKYQIILAKEICSLIHVTVYLGSPHSSLLTLHRAKKLSEETGATFIEDFISDEYNAFRKEAEFGESAWKDLALECLQARCRMVKIYKLCQMYGNTNCFGIVLASSNASELFVGYWTKYDAGSGDLCLIGGCSKPLVKKLGQTAIQLFELDTLNDIVLATPTAELKPASSMQTDESDMGITYRMNQLISSLMVESHLDPIDIFNLILQVYDMQSHHNIGRCDFILLLVDKLKKYIWKSFSNVHKRIIATQSLHIEQTDPDYKRACLMPNNVDARVIIQELELHAKSVNRI